MSSTKINEQFGVSHQAAPNHDINMIGEMPEICPHGVTKATALSEQTRALVALATTPEQHQAIARGLRQSGSGCCGQRNED